VSQVKEKILLTVDDLVMSFLYYDRAEDQDLPRGNIEAAIAAGEVTVDEITAAFREALEAGLA
jgi:hypothetical protein